LSDPNRAESLNRHSNTTEQELQKNSLLEKEKEKEKESRSTPLSPGQKNGSGDQAEIVDAFVALYNLAAGKHGWPRVKKLGVLRRDVLTRLREHPDLAGWEEVFAKAGQWPHALDNDQGWRPNLAFFLRLRTYDRAMIGEIGPGASTARADSRERWETPR